MDANRCSKLYLTLLSALDEKMSRSAATMYLREWQETARCDHVVDLSKHRAKIANHLGNGLLMNAIMTFSASLPTQERALQTMLHYRQWHRESLQKGLSWPDWIWYHTRLRRS